MTDAPTLHRREWFSAGNLFAAGLFCLVVGVSFGAKFIAAGQVLFLLSIARAFVEEGRGALQWGALGTSARWLVFYLVVAVLSLLVNLEVTAAPLRQLGKLRYLVIVLLVLMMPGIARKKLAVPWRRDTLVLAWLVPLAGALAVGAMIMLLGTDPFRTENVGNVRRISGFYGQVMTFANSLQLSVVALAIFLLTPSLWRKITRVPYPLMAVILFFAGAGLYLTYTRGAMLGVVVGFTIHAAMRSYKLFVLVILVGLVGATFAYFDGARYLQTKSPIRVNHWRAAAMSFVERPVIGFGYRNFEAHSVELKKRYGFEKDDVRKPGMEPRWMHAPGHAHNNVLESLASMGVFGGIAFLGFCYTWLREMWRSRQALIFVPLIGAFFAAGLFENTFYDSEVLNCILLIYLFSQWTRCREAGEGGNYEG